jgi:hypothetical protein
MNTTAVKTEVLTVGRFTYTYKYVVVKSGKTEYAFMSADLTHRKYVAIKRVSANPWDSLGKEFESFGKAQEGYKSPLVKTMILLAESALKNI